MIVPVILSGGSGTRLWPLSRRQYPKQFLSLVNETTLLQDTIMRLPNELSSPVVVCNETHRFIVAEQLRQINSNNNGIILEPKGKNTAPAIALASFNFVEKNEDPIILVLSADHIVEDNNQFNSAIKIGREIAEKRKIVTLGTYPKKPEVGYGYIEVDNSNTKKNYNIKSFTEKPTLEIATKYLKSGNYFWNSGIFMFKASLYLQELKKYEPEIYSICKKAFLNSPKDLDFLRIDKDIFNSCPNKSIDYAIMEKTKIGVVVPLKTNWSDVGSWESLWNSKIKDKNNNVTLGDTIVNNVKNSYIHSSNRIVAVNNLSDLIVVDTPDALLVSSKDKSQNITEIVNKLKESNRSEFDTHLKVYRPWGYYYSIESGQGFQVKRILVNPGAKLSLQKHQKRAEHWVVVKGIASVTCGDSFFQLAKNQSTYIPKGEIHRLENEESTELEIIEIQTGSYLGEDDIIRLDDEYQRN